LHQLEHPHQSDNDPYEITLILGNEACDLDSQLSALLWAYYMQSQTTSPTSIFIPVFGIPAKELKLRKEAIHLYQATDKSLLDALHTFFLDTVPIDKIVAFASASDSNHNNAETDSKNDDAVCDHRRRLNLNVHLVDHNALCIELDAKLGAFVTRIVDHHKDEGKYTQTCSGDQRTITVVGSNICLLVDHILQSNADIDIHAAIGDTFGALIAALILLDTSNFDAGVGKTTALDLAIYKLFARYALNQDSKQWFAQLLALRSNCDGFTFEELLVKDLKVFEENGVVFGIPAIPMSLENAIDAENEKLFEIMYRFQTERKLQLVPMLTVFQHNGGAAQRQFALFTDNQLLLEHVGTALSTDQNRALLGLQALQIAGYKHKHQFVLNKFGNKPFFYQWWNISISVSRKKMLPILRQILKSSKL